VNNEATRCAVLSPAFRAVERTTSTAEQHSGLQYSVPLYKPSVLKMNGSTCLAVSFFPSVIRNFLTELRLIKLCSLPHEGKSKVMPVHSTKTQRELAVSAQHDVFWTTALHGCQKSRRIPQFQPIGWHCTDHTIPLPGMYRGFHDLWTLLQEVIS